MMWLNLPPAQSENHMNFLSQYAIERSCERVQHAFIENIRPEERDGSEQIE
jgi:hypothetical protein